MRMSCMHACMCQREEGKKRAKQCEGKAAGYRGLGGGGLREVRRERREWKKEGDQVTPPRAAVAAGEITAPSLLARDVHKLCITLSGAHANELHETRDNNRTTDRQIEMRYCERQVFSLERTCVQVQVSRIQTEDFFNFAEATNSNSQKIDSNAFSECVINM